MKIVFDLTTPKQTRFFSVLGKLLEARGHTIFNMSREYYEMNRLEKMLGLKVDRLGKHGGRDRADKLKASIDRTEKIYHYFREVEPDLLITLSSPEASRVAFGLGVPIACFNDIPEAVAVGRLAVPLATRLFIPACVPDFEFLKLGAKSLYVYNSLDPCLWLEGMKKDSGVLVSLGVDPEKKLVVFRDEELFASYLSEAHGSKVIEAVRVLKAKHPGWQFVYLPRYVNACDTGMNVIVPRDVIDSAQLLAHADLFLGGGGSMNIESAYFGVPTINCRPLWCYYEKYLMVNGLTVKPDPLTVDRIVERSEDMMGTDNRAAAKAFFDNIKFPTDRIIMELESMGAK